MSEPKYYRKILARSLHILPWQDAAVRALEKQALTPVFIAGICATRLNDIYQGSPEDIARLGFTIAHCLDESAPAPAALSDTEHSSWWPSVVEPPVEILAKIMSTNST